MYAVSNGCALDRYIGMRWRCSPCSQLARRVAMQETVVQRGPQPYRSIPPHQPRHPISPSHLAIPSHHPISLSHLTIPSHYQPRHLRGLSSTGLLGIAWRRLGGGLEIHLGASRCLAQLVVLWRFLVGGHCYNREENSARPRADQVSSPSSSLRQRGSGSRSF